MSETNNSNWINRLFCSWGFHKWNVIKEDKYEQYFDRIIVRTEQKCHCCKQTTFKFKTFER